MKDIITCELHPELEEEEVLACEVCKHGDSIATDMPCRECIHNHLVCCCFEKEDAEE